jgi:hypothetical protein
MDEFDYCSHQFYFRHPTHQQISGAIQLCIESEDPEVLFRPLNGQKSFFERLGVRIPEAMITGASWTSKLFVEAERRAVLTGRFDSKYLMSHLLIFKACELAITKKVSNNWIHCHPDGEKHFQRLGYKVFTRGLQHPNMEIGHPDSRRTLMVLDLKDINHLIKIKSPLLHVLKNHAN